MSYSGIAAQTGVVLVAAADGCMLPALHTGSEALVSGLMCLERNMHIHHVVAYSTRGLRGKGVRFELMCLRWTCRSRPPFVSGRCPGGLA